MARDYQYKQSAKMTSASRHRPMGARPDNTSLSKARSAEPACTDKIVTRTDIEQDMIITETAMFKKKTLVKPTLFHNLDCSGVDQTLRGVDEGLFGYRE